MWFGKSSNSISREKLHWSIVLRSRELNARNKVSASSKNWIWVRYSKKLALKKVPGPYPSIPIIGTGWQYFKGGPYHSLNIHETCLDKFQRYGPVVKEEFQWRKPIIHVFDPEDIRAVFQHQGINPIRIVNEFVRYYRKSNPDRYDSVGLSNSLGEEWSEKRNMLGSALLKLDAFDDLIEEVDEISDDFVDLLRFNRDFTTHRLNNFRAHAERLALENIFLMCLNIRLGCLEKGILSTDSVAMIEAVRLLFVAYQELYYGMPLWKLFQNDSYKKLVRAESQIYDLSSIYIRSEIERIRYSKNTKSKKSVLNILMPRNTTYNEIKVTVMDLISAGVSTVSSAFTFFIDNLARHPDVQDKLYEEIRTAIPDGKVTKESLSKLPYLKACLKESFRITPTIPFINRILSEDVILSGHLIPPGIPLMCNFIVPCQQESVFSEPDKYIPDRWLDRKFRPHPFSMLPFGFGRRMCLGRRFAELEIYTTVAKLVYNFKIVPSGEKVGSRQDFILMPSHQVDVFLYEREKDTAN